MTYKDVIDRIHGAVTRHKMLADFGYGQLSDIKVHAEGTEADYPYLFLNPAQHTREGVNMVYNFNMIVMDVAIDEDDQFGNWINIQSQCQQYIDDIIAELHYGFQDKPIIDYTNVSYTPFKERFQDSLAGMTANITIEVPTPINLCVAPYEPPTVLVLDVESDSDQLFKPDQGDNPQSYPVTILDTYNAMRPGSANLYYLNGYAPAGLSNWTFTETGQAEKAVGTEPFVDPRLLTVRLTDNSEYQVQPTQSTFPTNSPIGEVFNYTVTWEIEIDPSTVNYVAIQDKDDVATEPQYWTKAGLNLKAYTNA